jgi:hypothetical protein
MQPTLSQAIGSHAGPGLESISDIPLYMAQGSHLSLEFPNLFAQASDRKPAVVVRTVAAIGDVETLLGAIADWAFAEHRTTEAAALGGPLA